MPSPADILRQEIPTIESISDAPKKYIAAQLVSLSTVRRFISGKLKSAGVTLTPEDSASIQVQNGIVSCLYFGKLEAALGLRRDNKMDLQLQTALEDPQVRAALKQHFGRVGLQPEKPDVAVAAQEPIEHGVPPMLNQSARTRAL